MFMSITRVLSTVFILAASGLKLRSKNTASQTIQQLLERSQEICSKQFWLTLKTCVTMLDDDTTFVRTGDIEDMWIRDSAAQLHPYVPLAKNSKSFQRLLEGALRSQAKFIAIDPYANAYNNQWRDEQELSYDDYRLLRGGYVRTANFELDDGPYFFRFLKTYTDAVPQSAILKESQIYQATRMLVNLYIREQNHNNSAYKYPLEQPYELPGGPLGRAVGPTGMVWNGFRPSDDAHEYGYHIPDNLFLASYLPFVAATAAQVWNDKGLASKAEKLHDDILNGVKHFGTKEVDGKRIYCYETDGLGNCNLMDDANVPSLLSIPYLDPTGENYNADVYQNTRHFILSNRNPWFFEGTEAKGIGSSHTGQDRIWPLSLVMQALTTEDSGELASLLRVISKTSSNDLLHESFDKDDHRRVTREWFAWPNALFAELVHSKGGVCGTLETAPEGWRENELPTFKAALRSKGPLRNLLGANFYTADSEQLRFRNPMAKSPHAVDI